MTVCSCSLVLKERFLCLVVEVLQPPREELGEVGLKNGLNDSNFQLPQVPDLIQTPTSPYLQFKQTEMEQNSSKEIHQFQVLALVTKLLGSGPCRFRRYQAASRSACHRRGE